MKNIKLKYTYWILATSLLFVLFYGHSIAQVSPCPVGSYAIDVNVCKLYPTGCPNGDSIPKDSPKCYQNNEPKKPDIIEQQYKSFEGK